MLYSDLWTMAEAGKVLMKQGYRFHWTTLPLEWQSSPNKRSGPSGVAVAMVSMNERYAEG